MDYTQKYLKYKEKYLKLKEYSKLNQNGGFVVTTGMQPGMQGFPPGMQPPGMQGFPPVMQPGMPGMGQQMSPQLAMQQMQQQQQQLAMQQMQRQSGLPGQLPRNPYADMLNNLQGQGQGQG
jgi:hypothetical protein